MVNSQEIVERTFYVSLLKVMIDRNYTINPEDYLPLSQDNERRFIEDKGKLTKFIPLYGIGNNQVRGPKDPLPRITLESQGYYPGDIGVERFMVGDLNHQGQYESSEFPFETKDIAIDVRLVSQTQADMRILHDIMYTALPARGYIKPYFNDYREWLNRSFSPSGNLFIEVGNHYDHQDTGHGLLEKVYTYVCKDGLLPETIRGDLVITPIKDISVLIGSIDKPEFDTLSLNLKI